MNTIMLKLSYSFMRLKNTILFKIALILIISVVIVLGLLGYSNYQREKKRLMDLNDWRAKVRMERLSFILREPVWTYNKSEIKRLLFYEFKYKETAAIVVKKENGDFFFWGIETDNDSVTWSDDQGAVPDLPDKDKDIAKIERELKYENSTIGYVDFYYSYKPVKAELSDLIIDYLTQTFFVSLILVLAIYFSLKRIIVLPIRELSQMMEEISEENYSSKLETKLKDEIGRLVNSFNKMLERLKNQRENLLMSEERYRTLVENAPEAIFSLNYKDAFFTSLNPAFERITGWKNEDWLGRSFMPLIHPEDHQTAINNLQIIKTGITPPPFELRIMNKGKKYFTIEVTATPKLESGQITGVLGLVRDIEERKRLENEILSSLKEKEILLKEIHHRVKNNLQVISSLLSLQAVHIKDNHALEMFKNSQNRVKSMALIHERLYKSDNLAQINFSEYVKNLTSGLFRSYQMNSQNVSLRLEIDDKLYLGVDMAIPCGLIVNELVTNALKYGFPDCVSGEIYINFSLLDDSNYRLIIGNDGISFPKNVDLHNSTTLGLQLVNILASQLKGTLELNSGGITEFIVIFPSRKNEFK